MADDESPPPPPCSPPPSIVPEDDRKEPALSNFKALQQMLSTSHTMYTSREPAPPPKPIYRDMEVEDSPKLEHRTRERPRRKTRMPSRSALREKALSSSPIIETDSFIAPPPTYIVLDAQVEVENSITSPMYMEVPISPPPSPPPSPPATPPPPSPPSSPPSLPSHSAIQERTSSLMQNSSNTATNGIKANDISSSVSNSKMPDILQKTSVSLQHKSEQSSPHTMISVVPFVAGDKSTAKLQTTTSTFTNRLKQIRERRAAQRKSPSPSALSPTHSASSLPQYLGPLSEHSKENPSLLSSLSVSPVTSQASMDSSTHESNTEIHGNNNGGLQAESIGRVKGIKLENIDSGTPFSIPSSLIPSLPPTPSATLPPSLPHSLPPALTEDRNFTNNQFSSFTEESAKKESKSETREKFNPSSEANIKVGQDKDCNSLSSSSSDCPPELPSVPPPPIPDSIEDEDPHLLFQVSSATSAQLYFDSPPLLPDIAETTSILLGTESSTAPSISSGTSTPRKGIRQQHHTLQNRPERHSAFEAMLISESSAVRVGEKRLSLNERRALTLQASRRPDANSNSVIKRWSDIDNLVSTDLHHDDRRAKSACDRLSVPSVSTSSDTGLAKVGRKRWRKQDNVANDSLDESGSNIPLSSKSRDSSYPSSLDTDNTGEESRHKLRESLEHESAHSVMPTERSITTEKDKDGIMPQATIFTKPKQQEEASLNQSAVGAELEDHVTNQPESLQEMQAGSQLSGVQEQQKECDSLLQGNDEPPTHNDLESRNIERVSNRSSDGEDIWEDSDDLENDPKTWTVEQVCEWLELVGLGTYRDTFSEKGVDGATLLSVDVHLFAELGVDSAEIRELFLSKIYELNNPSRHAGGMQDDFLLSVDSYTDQDWKKLEAAVGALKSPVLRDDIEIDPSAIGQFLHTDYVHSTSTPNIHQLQIDPLETDSEITSQSTIPHSSTMHSFSSHALIGQTSTAAATDQMPRKTRVPSTRSIKRQRIVSMAEAGDKPSRGYSSNHTTRPSSSVSSKQGSPIHSSRSSSMGTSPSKKVGKTSSVRAKKRKKDKSFESTATSPGSRNASSVLNQGVIVYENGKYQKIKLDNLQKESAMTTRYWDRPTSGNTTGLVRLFMHTVQEGLHYKAFLVTVGTSAEELVEQALERAHITDNPYHYCIWQVTTGSELSRVLGPSECPLTLQLDWPQFNSYHFDLRINDNIHRVKLLLDLPLCSKTEVQLTIPSSATATETVQITLSALRLTDTYSQRGIQCAVMDVTSKSRAERALGEKECPVTLLNTGHKLKLVSLSGQKRHSTGQSDRVLLARVHSLEQEKAMLTEQVQSAQAMMQSYIEASKQKSIASQNYSGDNEQEKDDGLVLSHKGNVYEVKGEEEQVIERMMRLNDALNLQLEKQREKITYLTQENKRLDQNVLDLSTKDKENVLEMGVLQTTMKGLKEQLSQSEQSREQLQQSLQAIDRSQPQLSLQLSSLQDSLRHAQQEITRLENISHETGLGRE